MLFVVYVRYFRTSYSELNMAIETTYTHARAKLASLLDEVTENREIVIIKRRGNEDVALITADELAGILKTAHLLRSPNNARQLLSALDKVKKGSGTPQTIEELRDEVGFEETHKEDSQISSAARICISAGI
jgi:antitoxin YefM